MALLSELVAVVSKATGVQEKTVAQVARHVREAGYITSKGRGRSAAHMSADDGANLLIAVMAAEQLSSSVDAVRAYHSLGKPRDYWLDDDYVASISNAYNRLELKALLIPDLTFFQQVKVLIASAMAGGFQQIFKDAEADYWSRYMLIILRRQAPVAEILINASSEIDDVSVAHRRKIINVARAYYDPEYGVEEMSEHYPVMMAKGGMFTTATVSHGAIIAVGELLGASLDSD